MVFKGEDGKWYNQVNFMGTIYDDEITDEDIIRQLDEAEESLDEAIKAGLLDNGEEEEQEYYE